MLNEERVVLMTRMASYEKREGRINMKAGRFFRSDYIAFQMLKAFFSMTIAYVLIFALYVFYNIEAFYNMDLVDFAKSVLLYYFIALAVYEALTYIVCTYRYVRARKSLKLYYKNLKKLNSMYNEG